jgi:carboxyl-terminal processing protease
MEDEKDLSKNPGVPAGFFPDNSAKKQSRSKKIYIWMPLCIAAGIAVGIFIGNAFSIFGSGSVFLGRKANKLDTVLEYINKAYVDTVNVNELVEDVIPDVLAGLDPHSDYFPAEIMTRNEDELEGHFSGIGVEFLILNDTLTIVNALSGGPSEAVGIKSGDRVVTVDDTLFVGKVLNETKVFSTLKGPEKTKIKLGIKRQDREELIPFVVTRAAVPVKSVDASYEVDDKIGYIKVSKFGSTTYNEFISAIAKLKSRGCESFIVDLQQNTGGYMEAAIKMVNEFLPGGNLILYTEGRAYPRENYFADGLGTCKTSPLVVLIDEGSASSSEIFAGAIQDNDRGLIVGRRSFGKGLVQTQYKFDDGSAMRLTIARYHTPSGRCVQKAYQRGDRENYSMDLYNRYNRGEFYSKDSIKSDNLPLFHTISGRPVYGNDGILSDVFVPRDTAGVNSYYMKVTGKGLPREYSYVYTEKNRDKLMSFKAWNDAAKYLSAQPLVDYFADYAYTKGIRRQPYLIEESRKLLQTQLEALIIRNIFGEDAFYQIYQRDELMIKEAVKLIKVDKATPDAISEGRIFTKR